METNKLVSTIVALAVVVICTALILAPTISSYSDETKVYTNEGVPFVLMDDQSHTMVITNNGGEPEYTVDGVAVDAPEYLFSNQSTVIYGEDGLLRVWKVSDTTRIRVQGDTRLSTNLADGESVTVEFDSSSVTIGENTSEIKPVAYLSNGTYSQLVKPVVQTDSTIYLAGLTEQIGGVSSYYVALCGSGTIDDLTLTVVDYSLASGVTVSNTTYEVTTTDLDNGLYKIDNIAVTFTMSDASTHTANYTYFIAPAELTYDNPEYIGSGNAALLDAIPVLVIVSLIVAAIGTFVTVRRD